MKIQTFTIVAGTSACNAKCPYCISKMTPKQGLGLKLGKTNWINFEKACRLAQINNVSTVLFTGKGEPLLYPDQLTEFLQKMQKYDFPIIEIQTNGLVFEEEWEKYEKYLKEWRKLGLNTIAFSIVHYKKEKNKSVYTPNSEYINLEEVKKMINFAQENKVEQLTIRGVTTPNKSINQDVYDWTKKHLITKGQLIDISEFLEKQGNKIMTLDHGGIVYDYQGQNICLSDCLTIRPDTEDLRQLIFFPDGHLRYDWQYEGAVLV